MQYEKDRGYAELHCDGASAGNPGSAGIGIVINLPEEQKRYRISEFIGITTNNVAEYSALIRGLEKANELGIKRVRIFLDSELIVRQMNGIYRVRNKGLMPLWIRARKMLEGFDDYKIIHVKREDNSEADKLAKDAIKRGRHGFHHYSHL